MAKMKDEKKKAEYIEEREDYILKEYDDGSKITVREIGRAHV